MDRRRFLSTSMLSGVAVVGLAGSARAFTQENCSDAPATSSCRDLISHVDLIKQLDDMLKAKGLSDDQRRAVLATAICPFCGQPLLG